MSWAAAVILIVGLMRARAIISAAEVVSGEDRISVNAVDVADLLPVPLQPRPTEPICQCFSIRCKCLARYSIFSRLTIIVMKLKYVKSLEEIQTTLHINKKKIFLRNFAVHSPNHCFWFAYRMKIRGCLQFYRLNQNSSKGCTKLTADYNSRTVTVPLSCFWLKNQRARISASSLPKFKPPLTTAKNNYDSKLIGFLEDSMGAPDLQDLILKKTLSEIQQPGLASIPRMEMHQSFILGHCNCHRYQCKCFASKRFLLRRIEVDLHMTYLSLAKEIKVDVTINKQTFNGTVSVKSPKQLCFPLWKFPKITGCLDFYNVIHSYQKTQGCVRLKSRFFVSRLDLLIGCFQFKLYADGSEEAFSGSLNPDKINFDADDDTSGTHDFGSRLL